MRSGAAAAHEGYFHETAFYTSDEELLAVAVPFLRGAQEAGEPALVTFAARNAALVRSALDDLEGVEFVAGVTQYRNPAQTIADYRGRFARLTADGATQIRVVGDVPHPGTGASWDAWARYEAAVNHAYDEFPLWGLCPYDVRITPDDVLEEVRRTHPHVADAAGGHHANPHFEDPCAFLAARRRPAPDPLQRGAPVLEEHDPTPAQARAAIRRAARRILDAESFEGLRMAVTEAVSNAARHGRPPVVLRAWTGPGRVVVTVTDAGPGPDDLLAGLLPQHGRGADDSAGLGLWIAHQLCHDVVLDRDASGFTIRLVAVAVGAVHGDAEAG